MTEPRLPRRIVTGHGDSGLGTVLSDGTHAVSRTVPDGATFHDMWLTVASPAPISATEDEPIRAGEPLGPPIEGTRVRIVDMPPGARSPMHRTESVDYGVVLAGEVTLVLDDGSATVVSQGDVVVQRGTDHAWENRTEGIVRLLFVLVGGRFDDDLRRSLPDDAVTRDV